MALESEVRALEADNSLLVDQLLNYANFSPVTDLIVKLYSESDVAFTDQQKSIINKPIFHAVSVSEELPSFDPVVSEILNRKQPKPSQKALVSRRLRRQQRLNHLALENVYRLNGITSFPIKQQNTEYLGVRFDLYSPVRRDFEAPHYIILSRDEKAQTYYIFKHTVPIYLGIEELEKQYLNRNMLRFVKTVHQRLSLTLKKKQVFVKLAANGARIIDANLSYNRVVLEMRGVRMQLVMDYWKVLVVNVLNRVEEDQKVLLEVGLVGQVGDLESRLEALTPA